MPSVQLFGHSQNIFRRKLRDDISGRFADHADDGLLRRAIPHKSEFAVWAEQCRGIDGSDSLEQSALVAADRLRQPGASGKSGME